VSTDDPQRTQEWTAPDELQQPEAAEARQAELRSELAQTDARRAEEQAGKAHEEVEEAEQREEKLSRKERKLKKRAERAEQEAALARKRAEEAEPPQDEGALSGAHVTQPGLGSDTDPAAAAAAASPPPPTHDHERLAAAQGALERPEVRVGLAFAGAFLAARVLKRIFD
jgi:septal ring factor EnvC (AmiA/AmiB activator)